MGKKHKKQKSEWRHAEDGTGSENKAPLKLVLKLGSEVMYDSDYTAHSPADVYETKHKKRKKKKRSHEEHREHGESSSKISKKYDASESELDMTVDHVSPDAQKLDYGAIEKTLKELSKTKRAALNKLLDHLIKQLERKDTHEIFAWPVNDLIAPEYSTVIDKPMDFSTMRNKILNNEYVDVNGFKEDFELMTRNCCVYNKPDTIYYQIAKKVHAAGIRIMSRERLLNLNRTLGFLHELPKYDAYDILGLPLEVENVDVGSPDVPPLSDPPLAPEKPMSDVEFDSVAETTSTGEELDLRPHSEAISFTDADNEDTVAPDVIQAAKFARRRLEAKKPNDRIGFLRLDKDGKTTLNILNPVAGEEVTREVDLGSLTSRLTNGIDVMPAAKEDKRNKVTPLTYLSYGPFGSFAPTYDSRIANLTQEESDLLMSAYGGETGYLFAQSMQEFVSGCDSSLMNMVDGLLDSVTNGEHTKTIKNIEEKRGEGKAEDKSSSLDSLRSLADIGIDVSFIDDIEQRMKLDKEMSSIKKPATDDVDQNLEHGSTLIHKLEEAQYERLGKKTNNEPNLQPPTSKEVAIADELQKTLVTMATNVAPGSIVSVAGVRNAMGINLQ
uniref:bromodomain-containing protein 7-like n=1 Tax=Ciona intestinalis TaxID=7719 RepID=UPI000180BEDD|nr:bromodomain-containing protein 7-like [Ciona intestinalis]|eukprot:XP_002127163.1 bromodomain-containing protein 7-like [Ciona intestinalis]